MAQNVVVSSRSPNLLRKPKWQRTAGKSATQHGMWFWNLDSGCRLLDPGSWASIQYSGTWILRLLSRVLNPGSKTLDHGSRNLEPGLHKPKHTLIKVNKLPIIENVRMILSRRDFTKLLTVWSHSYLYSLSVLANFNLYWHVFVIDILINKRWAHSFVNRNSIMNL